MQAIKRTLNMDCGFTVFKDVTVSNFSDYVIYRRKLYFVKFLIKFLTIFLINIKF